MTERSRLGICISAPWMRLITSGFFASLLSGCMPSAEEVAKKCARLTREQEVRCFNTRCEGDPLPMYDPTQQTLLKLNGVWHLGPREYFNSGSNGAGFRWPIGKESEPRSSIQIFFNGRGSWLIPWEPGKSEPRRKSSLDEAREAGAPIEFSSPRPGLDRYEVRRTTSYGTDTFTVYVATNRISLSKERSPTLFCRERHCTSGDRLGPDLFADYRVDESHANDWPEIHAEIVRILQLLKPIGPAAQIDRRPPSCRSPSTK